MSAKSLAIDFAKEKEAGYRRVFARSPLLTSLAAGWKDFYFAYDYLLPGEMPEVSARQHSLGIFIEQRSANPAERRLDGQFRREQVAPGDILITPAHVSHSARWFEAGGVIMLCFNPDCLARASYESIDPDRVELRPSFATADPLVCQLGLSLKAVLEQDGTASRLYAETMANALMVHLLHRYATRKPALQGGSAALPNPKLQQVIDYIQAYLEQDLGLEELATLVQISPHYFCQLFKQSTGLSPHQYVIRCRVERAKQLIREGEWAIAEVARRVGFVDQSHLHRHFKRIVGVTPKTFLQTCASHSQRNG